jgi:hypothetical protein
MWRGSTYPGSRLQHPSRPFLQWRTAEFEKRRKKQPPDAARRFVPATTSATLPVCLFDWKRCSVLTCLVQVSLHPTIIPTSTSAGHDDNGRQQRAEIRRKQHWAARRPLYAARLQPLYQCSASADRNHTRTSRHSLHKLWLALCLL